MVVRRDPAFAQVLADATIAINRAAGNLVNQMMAVAHVEGGCPRIAAGDRQAVGRDPASRWPAAAGPDDRMIREANGVQASRAPACTISTTQRTPSPPTASRSFIARTCRAQDPNKALGWMAWTHHIAPELAPPASPAAAVRGRRSRSIPSLAWHPEEKPDKAQMIEEGRAWLKAQGQEHQVMMVSHKDHDHPHLHPDRQPGPSDHRQGGPALLLQAEIPRATRKPSRSERQDLLPERPVEAAAARSRARRSATRRSSCASRLT